MIIGGIEEPIQINERLHIFDEDASRIINSRFENSNLNRYSFVWVGVPDLADEMLSKTLNAVLKQLLLQSTWLLAWKLPGYRPTRSKWLLSKRQKEGWSVQHEGTIAVAIKQIDQLPVNFPPKDYNWKDEGGFALIIGDMISTEQLFKDPFISSIETLITTRHFIPGKRLLAWLNDQQKSIVYMAKDAFERETIVITGTHRLNVEKLLADGEIKKVFRGSKSSLALIYTD